MADIRGRLLSAGVKNLREFGYSTCNTENILTDYVFAAFFERMLTGTIEDSSEVGPINKAATDLLAELNTKRSKTA